MDIEKDRYIVIPREHLKVLSSEDLGWLYFLLGKLDMGVYGKEESTSYYVIDKRLSYASQVKELIEKAERGEI